MIKNCIICNKIYGKEYPPSAFKNSKYCSRDCQIKSRTKKQKTTCDFCNKEIEQPMWQLKHAKKHFCNAICRKSYHNRQIKNCSICNKLFEYYNCRTRPNVKYCSNQCRWKGTGLLRKEYAQRNSGPRSKDRIRALETYGNKCELCGWSILVEVHHIDGNRNNHDINNLMILCPNHHTLTEEKYKDNPEYISYKTREEILKWKK